MYDSANLSREQFDALYRLFSSLDKPSSISGVKLFSTGVSDRPGGALTWYLGVEFLSGHGNRAFHVDKDGTSAPIENGTSELVTR
jgi:hypothetical protein